MKHIFYFLLLIFSFSSCGKKGESPIANPAHLKPSSLVVDSAVYLNPASIYPTLPFAFSQGVKTPGTGKTVFCAGMAAWDAKMQIVGKDDFREQLRQCFRNIKAVMEEAGGAMKDVTRLTYFIKSLDMDKAYAVVEVVKEFFPGNKYPTGSLIGVVELVEKDFMVEIEATGVIPD